MNENRLRIGILGLDNLFRDGIAAGSNVLLFGRAGTGKTLTGLEFIYRGAELFKEGGVYVSLEQGKDDLLEQTKRFGWDFDKYIKQKKISVLSFKINEIDRDFANVILDEVRRVKAKRLVIDNLSMLAMSPIFSSDGQKFSLLYQDRVHVAATAGQFIYNLVHILNNAHTTTLYLTVPGDADNLTKDGVSEYVCDGIINIRMRTLGKSFLRTIEVIKMRKSNIKGGVYSFSISDTGIKVEQI